MQKITEEEIIKALDYYDIKDQEYLNRSLMCLRYIEKANLMNEVENLGNSIFCDDLSDMWKIKKVDELIPSKDMWVTNLILLMGYKLHSKNMQDYQLDDEQRNIHKKRVKECLTNDIYGRKLEGIRFSQLLWGAYFVRIKIIEVGRLQYGLSNKDIHLHVFSGCKLTYEDVLESLKQSKKYIYKYFGLTNYKCTGTSWLLSRQIRDLLDDNSNISKFQSLFDITEQDEECTKDILNFVFNISECDDYNKLPENTSLQRKIKEKLLKGEKFYSGFGILKKCQ